jgi:hypothetical protein
MIHPRLAAACFAVPVVLGTLAGCATTSDTGGYDRQRPPIGQLDPGNRGLQGKDVVAASDQMAMELLADPRLNASRDRWLLVAGNMDNLTASQAGDLNIFIQRLKGNLFRNSAGRVQLIENRDRFRGMQSAELEQPGGRDPFGQGVGGTQQPGPAGIQPDYLLAGRALDLPGRASNYYNMEFTITDLRTRELMWVGNYEVQTRR